MKSISDFRFSKNRVFLKKSGKVGSLRLFCSVFPFKSPIFGQISKVNFDRKFIKTIDTLIFIMENRIVFPVLQLSHPIIEKTELK